MSNIKTTTIKASSRASVKIGDSYFTFESTIEKSIPEDVSTEDYEKAKIELWDEVNSDVDAQIADIQSYVKRK